MQKRTGAIAGRRPPDMGLSVATFRALINTYDAMVFEARPAEGNTTGDLERVNASFRKRLASHGLGPDEIEIALAYIIEQALKPLTEREL